MSVSIQYTEDIEHWAGSSTQDATCSVEPGNAEDVGKIVRLSTILPHTMPSSHARVATDRRVDEDTIRREHWYTEHAVLRPI